MNGSFSGNKDDNHDENDGDSAVDNDGDDDDDDDVDDDDGDVDGDDDDDDDGDNDDVAQQNSNNTAAPDICSPLGVVVRGGQVASCPLINSPGQRPMGVLDLR